MMSLKEEIKDLIDLYAHDYRNMNMSEEDTAKMLRSFYNASLDAITRVASEEINNLKDK